MRPSKEDIYNLLDEVKDPEVPVISVIELGIVRNVNLNEERILIEITPTYSGCPANKVIEKSIHQKLLDNGFRDVTLKTIYSPPWTTDWISETGKKKLKDYGIAPPGKAEDEDWSLFGNLNRVVPCPFCNSDLTNLTSEFGSTACKALYFCDACQQPFEHFKCI